jgi:hypothetical protein
MSSSSLGTTAASRLAAAPPPPTPTNAKDRVSSPTTFYRHPPPLVPAHAVELDVACRWNQVVADVIWRESDPMDLPRAEI